MKPFFLLTAVLLGLALVATGCEPADDTPPAGADTTAIAFTGDFDGPLGLQLWSVREAMQDDVAGTLAKVRDMGFREVELAGTYGMPPAQFRQMLDDAGLDATAMHVPFDRLRDSTDVVLGEAETLGAAYVGVAWVPHPEGAFTEAVARETADVFDRVGAAAKARGLQFFYHIHGYEFKPSAEGVVPFDVLVQETDPENVKFEMDVFWATRPGQDPVALLNKYPDRWELMHVKDMAPGTATDDHTGQGTAEMEVPVGAGTIDYAAILQAAEAIGMDRYYIEDETTDPLANIPKSVDYVETVAY